jgi:hypothetical protein
MTRKNPTKTKRQPNQLAGESELLRPDPTFKEIIGQAALAMGQEWRLHYRIGLIDVNIVVCRLLPMQERYYQILLFAPAGSPKWTEFVKIAIEADDSFTGRFAHTSFTTSFN